jgi:putative ABC transport system permease protein
MLEKWMKELWVALRSLVRVPLFTATVVTTLGIGIGGTVTLFSGVSAAYFRELPFPAAERLAAVWQTRQNNPRVRASMLNFLDWEEQNSSFEHMAAYSAGQVNVTSGDVPERTSAAFITEHFFSVLGISPQQGRMFAAEDTAKNAPEVVVISYSFARRIFPGDSNPAGKILNIEEAPFQVIGVMPPGFDFPDNAQLWLPLSSDDGTARSAHNYQVVARQKPGKGLKLAQADMETVAARLAQAYPKDNKDFGISVVPLRQDLLGRSGAILLLLFGAVALVLLICCTNVISLLLARTLARDGETTLRLVLGASRPALVRPFLVESCVLALLGGVFGLLLTFLVSRTISGLLPEQLLSQGPVGIDGPALLFTFGLTLAIGLLCGLAPALKAAQTDLRSALASTRTTRGLRGLSILVAAEVALACILLLGAGLLIRSVLRLEAIAPGFDPRGVALVDFSMGGLEGSRYADPSWRALFFDQLLEHVAAMPEVDAVGAINQAPLSGRSYNGTLLLEPGADRPADDGYEAHYRLIGGRYFQAVRIPLIQGRNFSPNDRAGSPLVAIVNQLMARTIAPDGQAIGLRVKIPGMDLVEDWATVVGIVGDIRHRGLHRDLAPEIYFPYSQRPLNTSEMTIVARGTGAPLALARRIGDEAQRMAPVPVELETMSDLYDRQLEPFRFRARILSLFAVVALILASIGIFGVVSYTTARRTREIGIRMALGADRWLVCLHMIARGMVPVLIGISAGLAATLALSPFLASLADGIPLRDPLTFAIVIFFLGAITVLANYLPARQASRIEPLQVLKAD